MSKIKTAVQLYRDDGMARLGKEIGVYIVAQSPLTDSLRSLLGEKLHEKIVMWPYVGYWPRIDDPRSFNEKIAYRKYHTNEGIYSKISDKWNVREYVEEKIGDDILTDVYYITEDPSTIPFERLPNEFVIKATHGSGWTIVVDDKKEMSPESVKSQCQKWLSQKYGIDKGEYWYGEIEPRLIIEKRLQGKNFETPPDFKFFVFHGEVKVIEVDFDRFSGHTQCFYDKNWELLDFSREYPIGPGIREPDRFKEMIDIAEKLGEDFDFCRIDLYDTKDNGVKFGEITLAPASGRGGFSPIEYDFILGSYW